MLFNSGTFIVFLVVVLLLYWGLAKRLALQNLLLLVASFVFYGWWDWRFLTLLSFSALLDYFVALRIARTGHEGDEQMRQRRRWLLLSVSGQLTLLGFFKYFNFFSDSFIRLLSAMGLQADPLSVQVVLPVGISFYTFQTMSYTIDVYRRKIPPTRSLLDFMTFVSFFPQLVAGPIERASHLLPQVQRRRSLTWEQIDSGLFLILWGYFKKMVIADRVAEIANQVFNNYTAYSGMDIFLGVAAFAVQIYADFSAYSDIARGVSRLMGFELMVNFRLPYFALNPSDFWQRWHISLSSWLRDYLYVPLGGNRAGELRTYRNLFITMLLGGLWHGAAWNYVLWGAYHGAILAAYRRYESSPVHEDPWGGRHSYTSVLGKLVLMCTLTLIGWLIFRASSLQQIGYMLTHVSPIWSERTGEFLGVLALTTLPLLVMQLAQYLSGDLLIATTLPQPLRTPLYAVLLAGILIFGIRENAEFIYFQF